MRNSSIIILSLALSCFVNCKDNKDISNQSSSIIEKKLFYDASIKEMIRFVQENDMSDDNLMYLENAYMPGLLELKNKDSNLFNQFSILFFLKIYIKNLKGNRRPSFRMYKESGKYSSLWLLYSGFLDISDNYNVNSSIENVYEWAKKNKDQLTFNESIETVDKIEKALETP